MVSEEIAALLDDLRSNMLNSVIAQRAAAALEQQASEITQWKEAFERSRDDLAFVKQELDTCEGTIRGYGRMLRQLDDEAARLRGIIDALKMYAIWTAIPRMVRMPPKTINPPLPPEVRELVDELTRGLMDKGLIIAAGWIAYRHAKDAGCNQLDDVRVAYFAGAQHLWASIMTGLEEGEEATPGDVKRMDLIGDELEAFAAELAAMVRRGSADTIN
jgi:hypothetical protein